MDGISQPKISFEYTYDNRGNIISEKRGTLTTTYAYDSLGQLVRVNDPLEYATWVYEYDRGGNITSKKKYAYTTGTLGTVQQTIPYIYGDSTWKDKLTSYNGQAISYDAIGNPLSDGTWTYTWQAGRQLKKMSKSGMTVEFKYDHNGLRTQKKVTQNGVTTTTDYTLHGKLVTHMTVGADELHFFYDAQSRPTKVNFNGTVYTYLHNLQGDIVGIVDGNGTLVVEYNYDAWGKLLSTIGTKAATLGKLNPFRYRGYIYDEETGFYYLQSRYYDAHRCRFVNVDNVLGSGITLFTHNIFAYCHNNCVMYRDPTGHDIDSMSQEGIRGWSGLPPKVAVPAISSIWLGFVSIYKQIRKLQANDKTYSKTKSKDAPKVYQLAIAFGTNKVQPFGPKISYDDAKTAIQNSLITKNSLTREYRSITGDKAPAGRVRPGLYTENEMDAERLAKEVAPDTFKQHGGHRLGDSGDIGLPHFHLGEAFVENIHIWYLN